MLSKLKAAIANFDRIHWETYEEVTPSDTFQVVDIVLKVGDGYSAKGKSRRKMQAFGFALRDIAEQIIKDNGPR